MSRIHARVTAYKGIICIEQITDHSIEGEITTSLDNPGYLGQVIHNTKEHLAVSIEAIELLQSVPIGHDAIGHVDWFDTHDGNRSFAWIGGGHCLVDPLRPGTNTARNFKVSDDYQVIENLPPEDAMSFIDSSLSSV